jgi:choice-of-anchor B domain-containing protein
MKKDLLFYYSIIMIVLWFIIPVNAQYIPGINNNVTLLSQTDDYQRYSNIWGYIDSLGNEYAIIGHNAGTSFYNITDPYNPVEVGMVPGPTAQGTIWREIKTYNKYAYVVSEHSNPNSLSGVQIIDISYLPDSVSYVGRYLWPGISANEARAHTVTVDNQGYLYIQGGTVTTGGLVAGGIRILSLADPENPVSVSTFDPRYVHDTFIQDTIMFAHNIYEGGHIDIISISDPSNPQLIHSHIFPNGFTHNSWTSEDRNYLVSTDEQSNLTVKIWDISVLWDNDPNNNEDIVLVGQYLSRPATTAHEPRVKGNYAFISHYGEGVRVVDISNPYDPVEVGYYDTPGDWGVWPFFPSGNFVVSDMQSGLYVLHFDSLNAGGIEGVITDYHTNQPVPNVTMRFVESDKVITSGSDGSFSFRTNEGEHRIILTKSGYYGDTVTVNLPPGSNITHNFVLENNLARVSVSIDSVVVYMPVDSVVNIDFEITNSGAGGVLVYTLEETEEVLSRSENQIIADENITSSNKSFLKINNEDQLGRHLDMLFELLYREEKSINSKANLISDLSWLSLDPVSGSLSAGMSDVITTTFDSYGLEKNIEYSGYIVLNSNDPTEPVKSIPVFLITGEPLSINDKEDSPESFDLGQNYPNPFNPLTVIPFSIREAGKVKIEVYNIIGQEIAVLLNKELSAGKHLINWNGKDHNGSPVASGVYFYTLEIPEAKIVKKMILNR